MENPIQAVMERQKAKKSKFMISKKGNSLKILWLQKTIFLTSNLSLNYMIYLYPNQDYKQHGIKHLICANHKIKIQMLLLRTVLPKMKRIIKSYVSFKGKMIHYGLVISARQSKILEITHKLSASAKSLIQRL